MALEHVGRDIYMRHTSVDGKHHVVQHRVWDAERFISSQQQAAQKVNSEHKGESPGRAAVQQITQDQYLKERRK